MLPPSPREFKDIYVVFELMETDLHQVDIPSPEEPLCSYDLLTTLTFHFEWINADAEIILDAVLMK